MNLQGFDYTSSEQVRDEVLGKGCEFVAGLSNELSGLSLALTGSAVTGLQRIADVPINFTDPMARRAPALQQTADAAAPTARMCEQTLSQLGLADKDMVRVKQGTGVATLAAKLDNGVPAGCVRVAAAHATTAVLADMFGSISVERA